MANEATDVWRRYAVLSTARSCEPFYFTGHGTRLSREPRSWILFARLPQSGIYSFRDLRVCRSLIFIFSPHHGVGFLFFALRPPRPRLRPPALPPLITSHSSQHNSSHHLSQPPPHTALITAPLITSHSSHHNSSQLHFSHLTHHTTTHHSSTSHTSLITAGPRLAVVRHAQYTEPSGGAAARMVTAGPRLAVVWQAQYTEPSGGAAAWWSPLGRGWLPCRRTQSVVAELLRAWSLLGCGWLSFGRASRRSCCARGSPLGRGWLLCGRRSTQSLLAELLRAWSVVGRGWLPCGRRSGWLSCGRRSAQSRLAELLRAWSLLGRGWLPCGRRSIAVHRASWRSCCHFVTHHLSHTIFHTPSQTIFHTPSFTHHFVTRHLWHTIFHTQLCRAPSFTTPSLSTPSFLHLLCLSFLPRPRYNTSCSLLEEVDLWGYPVLLYIIHARVHIHIWGLFDQGFDRGLVCWNFIPLIAYNFGEIYLGSII